MSKTLIGLLAACAAIAMIVAGCGSGDDTTTDSTASAELTKAQFLKQGNAICAKTNKELGEEFQSFLKEHKISEKEQPTTAELTEVAEDIVTPIVGRQIDEIRQLGAPAGEEEQVDKILTAAEEGVEKGEEDPNSLLGENGGSFAKANKLASEYGLDKCAE